MQKAEQQHKHKPNQPAQRQSGSVSLESPQGEQIAQLKAMVKSSPQAVAQRRIMDMIRNSPSMAEQRKTISAIHNSPHATAQRQQLDRLTGKTAQREAVQMRHAASRAQPEPHGVIQRARYSVEKRVSLTTAEKKWEEKDGQSAKKRAVGAMLAVLREEYPLPSNYTKTKDNNTDDNFRGKDFLERKEQILKRFAGVDDSAAEVISTRASIESNKEAGTRRKTSQAADVSRIAPGFKWIGAHLIKREWGGADNMWNVVAWPQEAEDKWADQFEKSVDTDGLYGRDPGTVAIAVTKEDDTIDLGFIDEVEKFSLEIGLNDPVTAEKAKKTGKFKEVVAKKRNYLNRALESIPVHAAGTNKLGTTTLSTGETRYDEAKESAKSEFADTVTDALADTSEVTRHKSDKTPIPTTMEEAERVESGKRLKERQKDWKEEKQNYRADKYEFTNTLFPEGG